jgi:UDP-N-acetylglucosamine/UDP-N-acetylgalactosamine diphosphorylase
VPDEPTLEQRYDAERETLARRGQQHVLRWWSELSLEQRRHLLAQAESIPWALLDPILETHVRRAPPTHAPENLAPPRVYSRLPERGDARLFAKTEKRGIQLLAAGKVAAFTVAGGQGTRLGVDGPKGKVVVTPVGNKTLFQLFGAMVAAARDKYKAAIPWYVMTSEANHDETVEYFEAESYFGIPLADVMIFKQGMLPAFDFAGRVLLEEKHSLAMAPDGHGGSLKALVQSGATQDMKRRGISIISYFQVDNPLVKPFDPLFLGLHADTGSEMSTKVARKADDLERVGNVCTQDGRVVVIEYSEFPEELARAKNADGSRMFDAGNLAIHALDVDFVERIAGEANFQLPFRRAEKIVPFIDDAGRRIKPERPNAVKLETFIFDALPLANDPLLLEADREEEFSPVKNATGPDSLETSRRDQVARATRWLSYAGVSVPRNSQGDPDVLVAISPRFAQDREEVKARRQEVPELLPGDRVYLE